MRLFVATFGKLIGRPATLITFGVLAALLVVILLAVSAGPRPGNGQGNGPDFDPLILVTFPAAYTQLLGFVLGLGGLFAVVYGAAIAGSEWTWGTFKSVVARGESRTRYLLSTFAAVAIVVMIGLLAVFAIGVGGAAIGATLAGVPLDGMTDTAVLGDLSGQLARGAVGIVTQTALGFTVATLARSQLAGIGFGIAAYFVGTFATLFLPDIVKYLPFQLAARALGGGAGFSGGSSSASALAPEVALVLLGVWLVGSLIVAAGFAERAEITG